MIREKNWVVVVEVEGDGEAEADPTFEVFVRAPDETLALGNAMTELRCLHPDVNFGKTCCWHIRRADGEAAA